MWLWGKRVVDVNVVGLVLVTLNNFVATNPPPKSPCHTLVTFLVSCTVGLQLLLQLLNLALPQVQLVRGSSAGVPPVRWLLGKV